MVWDLRRALHKKGEIESARLDDFEFRLRARTMRLLAATLGLEPDVLVARIAADADETIVASLGAEAAVAYPPLREEARRQLITELGDPTPYKLA